MKRLLIVVSGALLLPLTGIKAQVNPQQGYIITQTNDTVYGTIDYLSDASNAKKCLFRKEGETAFKTYRPSDILGYRLYGDGVYYVSRLFEDGEQSEMLFAEYLIQGGVSLFRYYHDGENYYGFVDTDGKEALLRDDKLNDDFTTYNEKLQARRENVQRVGNVMSKDPGTADQLWKMDMESKSLTKFVQKYDETYCTSEGDCVIFRYDTKKTAAVLRKFFLGAGVSYTSFKPEGGGLIDEKRSGNTYAGVAPVLFGGIDIIFPRFNKSLISQAILSFTPYRIKASKTGFEGGNPKFVSNEIALRLGAAYIFTPDAKTRPFLKGGLILAYHASMSEEQAAIEHHTQIVPKYYTVGDIDYGRATRAGFYLGGGVDINHLRISASYEGLFWIDRTNANNPGVLTASAAYLF